MPLFRLPGRAPDQRETVETAHAIVAGAQLCRSETRARDVKTVITDLAFNEPIAIEAPLAATPVATGG
jgi:hypothetical protein